MIQRRGKINGFTLLELLVTCGAIALLMGLLVPSLNIAREQARATVCQSNIHQLASANDMYAKDSHGVYVPGAADFIENLHRWHGERPNLEAAFDQTNGPLAAYYGPQGEIRTCPTFVPERSGFEAGCGGYGYNNDYIGVQGVSQASGGFKVNNDRAGAFADKIHKSGETLMFLDSAFAADALIEYSFAEPRFQTQYNFRADPSIHFRHAGSANVAWCDGHITRERMTFTWSSGMYPVDPSHYKIGWFGNRDDNTYFDLR
ncbi:MAG: hypothetical protein HY287_09625 [Planctomycetes bacterium]|nr:hypothetical protein [Planctomycetota bacterium]MBI3834572.1 hypothetical protein [Planctomycetota bacterium]